MSVNHIDNELNILRKKLASLEEQKKIEEQKEIEKINNPLKTLEIIIDDKRKRFESNSYGRNRKLERFYDQEKLATLEPIFNILKNIQERLLILENKN